MIALLLAVVLGTAQVQECGPYGDAGPEVGVVVYWGAPSADLAPVGVGACTMSAWVDPLDVEMSA